MNWACLMDASRAYGEDRRPDPKDQPALQRTKVAHQLSATRFDGHDRIKKKNRYFLIRNFPFSFPQYTASCRCCDLLSAFVPEPKNRTRPAGPSLEPKSYDVPDFESIARTLPPTIPLRRPDWFRLAAAPTRRAAATLHPPQHASEQAPREMALRQQSPVVTGVLYKSPGCFHQPPP